MWRTAYSVNLLLPSTGQLVSARLRKCQGPMGLVFGRAMCPFWIYQEMPLQWKWVQVLTRNFSWILGVLLDHSRLSFPPFLTWL